MNRYEHTSIWQRCLANQLDNDIYRKDRELLRVEFENFREKSKILAGEISKVLPEFTVHDISHIDALWDTAQLVTSIDFDITPTEAFVLGGSFLLHDLGMAAASFPSGIDEIKEQPIWKDTVAALLREQKNANVPESVELTRSIEQLATEKVLRLLHAQNAEKLATQAWKDENGNDYFLIGNSELRLSYGSIIGQIAHSHWWPAQELEQKLPTQLGAPGIFSASWTVDPVKLACILRIADAAQIDDRRAPQFLRLLRKPKGYSDTHWNFQSKLYQPRLQRNRLVFTSKSAFNLQDVQSWWVCHDTLKMIDHELREVDSLLADTGRPRLEALGVAGIEDPKRLSKLITVDGWQPIDTSIKVTNIAKLAESLGGKQLYGNNPTAPLRELVQNAADAVRARRVFENELGNFGKIVIRFGMDDIGDFIEVEDNGIGMSKRVLTGPFLDFGNSFWGSSLMHEELPGLENSDFASTGKYGIGFYSVFMWGDNVTVYSKRFEDGRDATLALEFNNGASSRPILRQASSSEYLKDGGTRIRVRLSKEISIKNILRWRSYSENQISAYEFIENFCPSIDCDVFVEQNGHLSRVIKANDWLSMEPLELIVRTIGKTRYERVSSENIQVLNDICKNMRDVKDDLGRVVGRIAVHGSEINGLEISGTATSGGIATTMLSGIAGLLTGSAHTASRSFVEPFVSNDTMAEWSTEQARLLPGIIDHAFEQTCATTVKLCGGHTGALKFAKHKSGYVSYYEIVEMTKDSTHNEYILLDSYRIDRHENNVFKRIELFDNVIITKPSYSNVISTTELNKYRSWPETSDIIVRNPLLSNAISAIADGWALPVAEILKFSSLSSLSRGSFQAAVGTIDGELVILDSVEIIRKSPW